MSYLSDFYASDFEKISHKYPNLEPIFEENKWQLTGTIEIIDEFGKKWDEYQIKIVYPHSFPNAVPILFETGGLIPKEADYHVNSDGSCCLTVPALEMIILNKGINTIDFLEQLVIPYLANQTYRRKKGNYAGEEFAHGIRGILQFYTEVFKTDSPIKILNLLKSIALNQVPGRNAQCPCLSGKKYKYCHRQSFEYLSPVNKKIIFHDFKNLLDAINKAAEEIKE